VKVVPSNKPDGSAKTGPELLLTIVMAASGSDDIDPEVLVKAAEPKGESVASVQKKLEHNSGLSTIHSADAKLAPETVVVGLLKLCSRVTSVIVVLQLAPPVTAVQVTEAVMESPELTAMLLVVRAAG